jgi:P27 family predicted phage terminase small subunit
MPRRKAAPALQLLRGVEPGRINRRAPRHTPADGDPPEWLSEEALGVWRRVVPELQRFDLLSTVETDCLVAYCEAVATHRAACEEIAENGITVIGGSGGLIKNPACTVKTESARIVALFAREFGLTPSARSNVVGPVDRSVETIEDFFSQNQ